MSCCACQNSEVVQNVEKKFEESVGLKLAFRRFPPVYQNCVFIRSLNDNPVCHQISFEGYANTQLCASCVSEFEVLQGEWASVYPVTRCDVLVKRGTVCALPKVPSTDDLSAYLRKNVLLRPHCMNRAFSCTVIQNQISKYRSLFRNGYFGTCPDHPENYLRLFRSDNMGCISFRDLLRAVDPKTVTSLNETLLSMDDLKASDQNQRLATFDCYLFHEVVYSRMRDGSESRGFVSRILASPEEPVFRIWDFQDFVLQNVPSSLVLSPPPPPFLNRLERLIFDELGCDESLFETTYMPPSNSRECLRGCSANIE